MKSQELSIKDLMYFLGLHGCFQAHMKGDRLPSQYLEALI